MGSKGVGFNLGSPLLFPPNPPLSGLVRFVHALSGDLVHPKYFPSGTLRTLGHSSLLFTFQPSTVTCTHGDKNLPASAPGARRGRGQQEQGRGRGRLLPPSLSGSQRLLNKGELERLFSGCAGVRGGQITGRRGVRV